MPSCPDNMSEKLKKKKKEKLPGHIDLISILALLFHHCMA